VIQFTVLYCSLGGVVIIGIQTELRYPMAAWLALGWLVHVLGGFIDDVRARSGS
jgi:hypothetical protein